MLNPEIRDADASDIPVIQQIAHAAWWPTYGGILSREQCQFMLDWMYSTAALSEQMAQGVQFLLLRLGEKHVGFAAFEDAGKAIFKLHKLYLHPSTHGLGLGRILLHTVDERVKKAGGNYIDLNVNRHNVAQGFYEKLGFKTLREEDNYIGRGYWMNDFLMRKKVG